MIERNYPIFHFLCVWLVWKTVKPDYDKFRFKFILRFPSSCPGTPHMEIRAWRAQTNTTTPCHYDNDRYCETINPEQKPKTKQKKWKSNFYVAKKYFPTILYSSGVRCDIGTNVDNIFPICDGKLFFFPSSWLTPTKNLHKQQIGSFPTRCQPNVRLSVNLDIGGKQKNYDKKYFRFISLNGFRMTKSLLYDRFVCASCESGDMNHVETVWVACRTETILIFSHMHRTMMRLFSISFSQISDFLTPPTADMLTRRIDYSTVISERGTFPDWLELLLSWCWKVRSTQRDISNDFRGFLPALYVQTHTRAYE